MPVKFKLGFTIDAQTLFGIMAKVLPIEDLNVEEVMDRPAPPPLPHDWSPGWNKQIAKPERVKHKRVGGQGKNVDLTRGVNAIIMAVLLDGKKHAPAELTEAIAKTTYSPSGLGSRLERLRRYGFIHNPRKGEWAATPKGLDGAKQSES